MSTKKDSRVTKCHNCDNIALAMEALNSVMRRKGLGLGDMYHAINRMIDQAVNDTIMRLRAEGRSIREISRTVHMDDSRVSQIIKTEKSKSCCGKQCKPCKPAKQYAPCKEFEPCKPCKPYKPCKK